MRFKEEQPLKDLINSFVDQGELKPKLLEAKIIAGWPKWVGEPIAKYTEKIQVVKGQLIIHISSAPLRNELGYQRQQIRQLVNRELNFDFIEDVIVK